MRILSKITTVALVCLFAVVSCKDNSTNGFDPASAIGLWKLDSSEGDVNYVYITETTVSFYDYQGDAYDEGEDCYIIGTEEIIEIDGNTYKFSDPEDPENIIEVKISVNDNRLTVEQPFGNGTISIQFTRHNGNVNAFIPECTDEVQPKAKLFNA